MTTNKQRELKRLQTKLKDAIFKGHYIEQMKISHSKTENMLSPGVFYLFSSFTPNLISRTIFTSYKLIPFW